MQVILAQPRGFCAGVKRAIKIVSRAIEVYGAPLYVRHEIVHNRTVVEELKAKGAIFVDDISQVPDGATLIFSAHGVPRSVSDEAHARPLRIFDATCPLVTKVHRQVVKLHNNGKKIIMIGHAGHPEVEGTMGQIDEGIYLVESVAAVNALELESTSDVLSYVTQTTISVDDAAEVISALKAKFPSITEPKKNDVCYATQNRQDAVKRLADACDLVLVVGSVTSSNSNRLREVAERHGCTAKLIDTAADMQEDWFEGVSTVGITAGASALRIISCGFIVSSVSVVSSGALEGLGKGNESLAVSLLRYLIIIVPLAFVLSQFFGVSGVWHSFWITEAITAIISYIIYKKALLKK